MEILLAESKFGSNRIHSGGIIIDSATFGYIVSASRVRLVNVGRADLDCVVKAFIRVRCTGSRPTGKSILPCVPSRLPSARAIYVFFTARVRKDSANLA